MGKKHKKNKARSEAIQNPIAPRAEIASPAFTKYAYAAGIALVTLVIYLQVKHFDFLNFDDGAIVAQNPVVTNPGRWKECFQWAIFTPHFKPVTFLLWQLEYRVFGANAGVFHIDNVLLHISNSILVYLISLELLPKLVPSLKERSLPAAFAVGLLFAVHPMHVESVAWVVERKDVLSTFFFLASWLCYIRYLRTQSVLSFTISAVLFLWALFSKSITITLPAVLILTDIVWQRRFSFRMLADKLPFVFVALLAAYYFGLLTDFSHQAAGLNMQAGSMQDAEASNLGERSRPVQSVLIICTKLVLWFAHMLYPFKLSLAYDSREILGSLGSAINVLPLVVLLVAGLAIYFRKKHRWIFFSVAFYGITILPALATNKAGGVGVFLADRYTYIPVMGFAIVIVSLLFSLPSRYFKPALGVMALATIAYAAHSYSYLKVWKNSETLWTSVINNSACNAQGYSFRASYYFEKNAFEKGFTDADNALKCDSNYIPAYLVRGVLADKLGKKDLAYADVQFYLKIKGKDRYEALMLRSVLLMAKGKNDSAFMDVQEAIRIDSRRAGGYRVRAAVHGNLGRYDEALADVDRYESMTGKDSTGMSDKYRAFLLQQKAAKASGKTVIANSQPATTHSNPAMPGQTSATPYSELIKKVYDARAKGDHGAVIQWTTKCMEQKSNDPDLFSQRGVAYINLKEFDKALADINTSIALKSKYPEVYYFRSRAYKGSKNYKAAYDDALKAKQLGVSLPANYLEGLEKLAKQP